MVGVCQWNSLWLSVDECSLVDPGPVISDQLCCDIDQLCCVFLLIIGRLVFPVIG